MLNREDNPVLFFNASELPYTLDEALIEDLNWEFSADKSIIQYVHQIQDVLLSAQKTVLIFIDAIDEWSRENAAQELSEFIMRTSDKRIKFCMTCKTSQLEKFLFINGNPSHLKSKIYTGDKDGNRNSSVSISVFNSKEKNIAAEKYQEFFSLKSTISGTTMNEVYHPLMMRTVATVYKNSLVPTTLNSVQIFNEFLTTQLNKSSKDHSQHLAHLRKIAGVMLDKCLEEVFEYDLSEIDFESHTFLINYGILSRREDEKKRAKISFVYDPLRNYVIVYHLLRIDEMNGVEMTNLIRNRIRSILMQNVLIWYKPLSNESHKQRIQELLEERHKSDALKFVTIYENIAEQKFPIS